MAVPTYDAMYNPLLQALRELGGSASVDEMEEKVAELLGLSEEDVSEIHRKSTTKLRYRLAWTRNYLKRFGLLENSSRGVWALTATGKHLHKVDKDDVNRVVKSLDREGEDTEGAADAELAPVARLWEEEMLEQMQQLTPKDFEYLCQRILRESGFVQVEVTGRSGDGGIDGKGIIKLGGLLSFHVVFQCKRCVGRVSSQQIRDFRGAMAGRSTQGLVITTGTFTRDARQEATRDGTPPVDLIDGDDLVQKMKELGLGVKIKSEEIVETDKDWFKTIN
jgi:restriction system protein